jgi:hypothetical protein
VNKGGPDQETGERILGMCNIKARAGQPTPCLARPVGPPGETAETTVVDQFPKCAQATASGSSTAAATNPIVVDGVLGLSVPAGLLAARPGCMCRSLAYLRQYLTEVPRFRLAMW